MIATTPALNSGFLLLAPVKLTLRKYARTILLVTLLAAAVGGTVYVLSPKTYEAVADVIVRNPHYGDKNYLYNTDSRLLDYFGNEDDGKRLVLFASSDLVQKQVIRNMGLARVYRFDTTRPAQRHKLEKKFSKSLTVWRTDYGDVMVSYKDANPVRAAKVANECVRVMEITVEDFYADIRSRMHGAITAKIAEEDSIINILTDSLARLREQFGIYDIISPARHNMIIGPSKNVSGKNYGLGIELIQNVESLKDEVVSDRAVKTTLARQYTASYAAGRMPVIKVVTEAKPPVRPNGPGSLVIVLLSALSGLIFTTLFVLFREYLAENRHKVRHNI